ncbi:hypothetical protein [Cupriavidus nantongensis]|uniref:hypothetical protein n=1 Tax=Cupriavidus nantongensis TaxID=1796606 RepID=UPI00358E2639
MAASASARSARRCAAPTCLRRDQLVRRFALRLLDSGEPIGERRGLSIEAGADFGLRHSRVGGLAAVHNSMRRHPHISLPAKKRNPKSSLSTRKFCLLLRQVARKPPIRGVHEIANNVHAQTENVPG